MTGYLNFSDSSSQEAEANSLRTTNFDGGHWTVLPDRFLKAVQAQVLTAVSNHLASGGFVQYQAALCEAKADSLRTLATKGFSSQGESSLAEVLALSGLILPTAALRHIEVQRVQAHEKRTRLTLDLTSTPDHEAVNEQMQATLRILPEYSCSSDYDFKMNAEEGPCPTARPYKIA